jgi:hypothetical protein
VHDFIGVREGGRESDNGFRKSSRLKSRSLIDNQPFLKLEEADSW